jgi:hypothetical protein
MIISSGISKERQKTLARELIKLIKGENSEN